MTDKDLHSAVVIASRFRNLHNAAKNTQNAIVDLKLSLFHDSLSIDDMEILEKAFDVVCKLHNNSIENDAIQYIKKLNDEQR